MTSQPLFQIKNKSKYPTYEEIINEFSLKKRNKISQKSNSFGYWMQTLADIHFLNLELEGLCKNYQIDAINGTVDFIDNDNLEYIKNRIAHLDTVNRQRTLYSKITDLFGDTNAYAFHNLYPYKGKFYPRLVRSIVNTFNLNDKHLILDPFNGCGTTTHECALMGIKAIGVDINPIGNIIANVKNEFIFAYDSFISINEEQLTKFFYDLKDKKRPIKNETIYQLFLLIYFDTIDAFVRTTRYNKKGELSLFIEKFFYIKECYLKLKTFLKEQNLVYTKSLIKEGTAIDLKKATIDDSTVDAVITSPPYYFSLDYVGKDKIAYDYLNEIKFFHHPMNVVKNEYLGMKVKDDVPAKTLLEKKVITYFTDLEKSIKEIARVTKNKGKIAIVIGDSTLKGKKLPTTEKTHQYCLSNGMKHLKTIFNPLLGARNRAIRGESILLYENNK